MLLVARAGTMLSVARPPQHMGLSLGQAGSEERINFLRFFVLFCFVLRAFCVCDKPAQVLVGLHDHGQRHPAIPELA